MLPDEWKKGIIIKLPKKGAFKTAVIGEELHYFLRQAKFCPE
jgi:hypothetical protein